MTHGKVKKPSSPRPCIAGTGLIALDAVISVDANVPVRYWAGGTCGNVLIVLSYLGWSAKPVARLSTSSAAKLLIKDLSRWRVSRAFVRMEQDGSTPVIVEHIKLDAEGNPKHSFHWRCDGCGSQYPGYKPELLTVAEQIAAKVAQANVFFFDRVSAGALHLAQAAKKQGALVVFEPCGIGNPLLFRQAWEVSHVVKYSHERLSDFPELDVATQPSLVIETLGDAGLRYCRRTRGSETWANLPALPIGDLKDAAGAGDWCTAGIISQLGTHGSAGFANSSQSDLELAIRYGQALAAWNCRFEGARGGMYAMSKKQFQEQVRHILAGTSNILPIIRNSRSSNTSSSSLCVVCKKGGGTSTRAKARKAR